MPMLAELQIKSLFAKSVIIQDIPVQPYFAKYIYIFYFYLNDKIDHF